MKKLAFIIPDAVGRDEILRMARAQRALRRWSDIVGPELAKRSQPDRFERGTVWVAVTGSAWAQELRMIKEKILERLRDACQEKDLFKDVRFGVRPIVKPPAQPEPKAAAAPRPHEDRTIREIAEERLRSRRHARGD
jgi:predicted nucleic acid-binding Zn ribbon protein